MAVPPQPIGQNWSNILRTGAIVLAVIGAAAIWIMDDPFAPEEPKKETVENYSRSGGARLSFDDIPNRGYALPEPPKPAPQPTPPSVPPPPKAEPAASPEPVSLRQPKMASQPPPPARKRAAIALIGSDDAGPATAAQSSSGRGGGQNNGDEYRPGMSDGIDKIENRMGNAAAENRWLASAGTRGDDFVTSPLMPPISQMMLRATTMIPATTIDASTSDLPDDIGATVDRDIYDSIYGKCVLIPYGSIIYGRMNNQIADFQTRGQGAITRILFPNGRSRNIGAMNLTDAEGRAGIEAEVDRHLGGMAAAIAGAGFFAILGQAGQIARGGGSSDDVNVIGIGGSAAGQQTASIGNQLVNRQLNRPNTLGIPVGWPVAVQLTKDMALPPYVDYPNYPDCGA